MRDFPLDYLLEATDLLILIGEFELAGAALEIVESAAPHSSALHLLHGTLAHARGEETAAIVHFRLAAGRDPLAIAAWQRLAVLLPPGDEQVTAADRAALLADTAVADLRRGKPYLALGRLTFLQDVHAMWPEWSLLLAEALRQLDAPQRAKGLVMLLVNHVPPLAPALWMLAALENGDSVQARTLLRQAISDDPAYTSARRCFVPGTLPFSLPPVPMLPVPDALAARLAELSEFIRPPTPLATQPQPLRVKVAKGPAPSRRMVGPTDPRPEEALQQVQQATQRLLGSTQPPLGDGGTIVLLVTRLAGLRTHSPTNADRIMQLIQGLRQALGGRGVTAYAVVVDDHDSLDALGHVSPTGDAGADAITEVVRAAAARVTAGGQRIDAILLIGGDEILPFHQLGNPTTDADRIVPTDNPYGCLTESSLIPDVVVARIPDGTSDDGALLMSLLQRSIDFHHGWLSTPSPASFFPLFRGRRGLLPAGSPVNAWAASAVSWQLPSQTVYNTLKSNEPLVLCPPQIGAAATSGWNAQRLLYFNLHGLSGGANWYGQVPDSPPGEALPVALTPDDVGTLHPNMICVSEACYGAEIAGRTTRDSIALRMLARNTLSFVGSTATAYGSVGLPLGGADVLMEHLLSNLRRGHPVGRALLLARDGLARSAAQHQGYLDPDDAKTLLSFVLLGDPWATPYARPVIEPKAILPHLTPNLAKRQPIPLSLMPSQHIAAARQLISKFVPYLREAQLIVDGQSRVNRAAKGPGEGETYVFSARSSFVTTDGQTGAHVARLTVIEETPRKLLVSR